MARGVVTFAVLLLLAGPAGASAQDAEPPLRATLQLRSTTFFEGEPLYLLAVVHNPGPAPRVVFTKNWLINESQVSVHSSTGADMLRSMGFVDVLYAYGIPRDTIPAGGDLHWVMPLHWFFGSREDTALSWMTHVLGPGSYRADLVFPRTANITDATVEFAIRERTADENRILDFFRAWVARFHHDVRAGGSVDSALGSIGAAYRDTVLAPFHSVLLLEIASVLPVRAGKYSASYEQAIDSLRRDLAQRSSGPDLVRLRESLDRNR